jgi:Ca2+:H+ antiporter
MLTVLKQEKFLLMALIAAVAAYPLEHWMLNSGQPVALASGLVLIAFIVAASMRVAHQAELLAEKVGDPYGTMILTLAAVLVEVVILAIMMSNEASKTLVRDTIYSAACSTSTASSASLR